MLKSKPVIKPFPVNNIRANSWNCNVLSEEDNQTLKQHLREEGSENTQPIIVRKIQDEQYEIVDGEHRWLIAKELGWQTINAIEREADDLQSKALCISYNRWRGHLNWIKLYNIIKQDQDNGINIQEAYKDALPQKDIEQLLNLGNLTPTSKKILEDSLIKHPEITLEQLYLIALIPPVMQQDLVEQVKPPLVTKILHQVLKKAQQQKDQTPQQPPTPNQQYPYNSTVLLPNEQLYNREDLFTQQQTTQQQFDRDSRVRALLLAASYCCDCGQHYMIHFKNMTITKHKQNQVFEHLTATPRNLQVHCNKCGHNVEITLGDIQKEAVEFVCVNCRPVPRKGKLDVTTCEATWLD